MPEQASFLCPQCRQMRLFTRNGTNHILHLLISLFLCGLWIPFWILIAFSNGSKPYFCSICGYANTLANLADPMRMQRRMEAQRLKQSQPSSLGKYSWVYILTGVMALLVFGLFAALISNPSRKDTSQNQVAASNTPRAFLTNNTVETSPVASDNSATVKTKQVKSNKSRAATIISQNANLRDSADQNGFIVQTLPEGAAVEVIKQKGAWFYIDYFGQKGWLHGNTIRYESDAPNDKAETLKSETAPRESYPSSTTRTSKTSEPEINNSGATAKCRDGTLSYSAHRRGTCSHHGGVAVWY